MTKPNPTPTPAKRTPGLWKVHDRGDTVLITTEDGKYGVCRVITENDGQRQANAAYICEACNSYERILAEREELAQIMQRLADNKSGEVIVYNNLRAEARDLLSRIRAGK